MTLSNVLTASFLGLLSFSGAVAKRELAQSSFGGSACEKFPHLPHCQDEPPATTPGPNVSSAHCSAVAWGFDEATNKDQSAQAAADAHAFICGDGSAEAHAIAQASARAFARAVASASVSGEVHGTGSCWANAHASAEAEANVWLDAYAEAFASSAGCEHCEAWAESWAYVREKVFLKAQADAKATLGLYANGGNVAKHVHSYAEEIEEAIVSAYAEALAGTATYYDTNACWAWTGVHGCILPNGPCASCVAQSVGHTYIEQIPGFASAVADASAFACGSEVVSFAYASAWAKALAEVLAIATAESYVSCQADDGGYACGDAGAFATDTAEAVAEAYASAWAEAIACGPDCYVDAHAASQSIGHVLVTAATSAYSAVCADGGSGTWASHDFQQHIEQDHIAAIAQAISLALALDVGSGGFCLAAATAGTYDQ